LLRIFSLNAVLNRESFTNWTVCMYFWHLHSCSVHCKPQPCYERSFFIYFNCSVLWYYQWCDPFQ